MPALPSDHVSATPAGSPPADDRANRRLGPPARPATAARERAGFTLTRAAKRVGVTPAYLQRTEREGAPYVLAIHLAELYGCGLEAFFPPPERWEPLRVRGRRRKRAGGQRRESTR